MEVATQAEFDEVLRQHNNIQYVDFIFADLCGYIRGKRVPILEATKVFKEGLFMPFSAFYLDALGGVSNVKSLGWTDGDPDSRLLPISNSIKPVPWDDRILQVMISLSDKQEKWGVIKNPSEVDPRNMLRKIIKKFDGSGWNPVVAFELEFYLFDKKRDNEGKPVVALGQDKTQVYGIADLDIFRDLLHEINENCKIQNVPATNATSEFSPGQLEVNLHHGGNLIKAADDAAMLRRIIKETSSRHGFDASFMAKPYLDHTGSGQHLHISCYDDTGKNIFATKNRYGNDFLKYAISGFQETFYDSFPIFIPNVNGFRRIQTRNFVPVNKSWSWNRRDVSLRIPAGSDSSKRIEHRVASADANPYLVLACILAGLHYGLTKKQMPTNKISFDNNEGADKEADPEMPKTLTQALKRFKSSKILRNYFGQEYIDLYIAVKQGELERMEQSFIPREEYSFYL